MAWLGFLRPAGVKDHPPSWPRGWRRRFCVVVAVFSLCLAAAVGGYVVLSRSRLHKRDAVFSWALRHGAIVAPELRIQTRGGVRGFFADSSAIAANTTVIAVPRELLINEAAVVEAGGLACAVSGLLRSGSLCDTDCLHSAGVKKRKQRDVKYRERMVHKTALAVFLMERFFGPRDPSLAAEVLQSTGCSAAPAKGDGRHDPYVKALPGFRELGLLALTLGLNEPCYGVLNGTLAWQRSLNKRVAWAEQFDYLRRRGLFAEYTLDEFLHAVALVKSRSFDLTLDGMLSTKQPAMVPFGDLMNMAPEPLAPPVIWYNHVMDLELVSGVPQKYLIFRTAAEVKPHTELLTTYGAHHRTNSELIQNYGFTLESWPSEAVPFALILPSNIEMRGPKRDLLDMVTSGAGLSVPLRCDNSLEEHLPLLLALARIAAVTDADVHANSPASAAFRRAAGDSMLSRQLFESAWRPDKEMLSMEHEARSLVFLVELMESDLLLNFPQAASIDTPPATSDPSSFHRRQCVGYIGRTIRDSYGTVLDFCHEALRTLALGQGQSDAWQAPVSQESSGVLVPKARLELNQSSGAEERQDQNEVESSSGRLHQSLSELGQAASVGYVWSHRFTPTAPCSLLASRLVEAWRTQQRRA